MPLGGRIGNEKWNGRNVDKKREKRQTQGRNLRAQIVVYQAGKRCVPEGDRRHAQRDFFSKSMGPASSMRQAPKSGSCTDGGEKQPKGGIC